MVASDDLIRGCLLCIRSGFSECDKDIYGMFLKKFMLCDILNSELKFSVGKENY